MPRMDGLNKMLIAAHRVTIPATTTQLVAFQFSVQKPASTNPKGMAAIDVFESEPILQGHALLRLENCICTPHIGYVEQDSYELYFGAAFDNIINFIQGKPSHIVNPEALQSQE